MRVVKFVTLFLALAVVTGCSHRRAHQTPVRSSLCECAACRCDQERLIREGAVPADRYNNYQTSEASQTVEMKETTSPFAAPSKTNDFAPEYAAETTSTDNGLSPFSSGNPMEMDSEAPGTFSPPAIEKIKTDSNQFRPSEPAKKLQLKLPSSNPIIMPGDVPSETIPDGAFKPFDRDVFKVKSKIDEVMPLQDQPSILIEKISERQQPDLGSLTPAKNLQLQMPKLSEPETNDFQIPDSITADALSLKQEETEITAPVELVSEALKPHLSLLEPKAETVLPPLQETPQIFAPVARPIRQIETVVQGEFHDEPVVLYARQPRERLAVATVQTPETIKPVSAQKPAEPQGIVQNSQYDPIYGLPLTNNVDFDSLPAIQPQQVAPQQVAPQQSTPQQLATSNQAQHLHVHIHHDYSNAETGQTHQIQRTSQQGSNVQVVYRDDEGRVIMAPPTPAASINSAQPINDQRTYYVPPEQILRLKATSPISRPRSNRSVATIQMRDTIIHGGTHLLATPEYQAQPVLTNHGLPGINHEKLREAFKTSPTDNPLR